MHLLCPVVSAARREPHFVHCDSIEGRVDRNVANSFAAGLSQMLRDVASYPLNKGLGIRGARKLLGFPTVPHIDIELPIPQRPGIHSRFLQSGYYVESETSYQIS